MTTEVNANERKRERLLEDVNPYVYPSSINIPKHFTIVLKIPEICKIFCNY